MAKSCQTSSNSWLISRYYLRYFPCLTAIYLIFITIFEMKTRPNLFNTNFTQYQYRDQLDHTLDYHRYNAQNRHQKFGYAHSCDH